MAIQEQLARHDLASSPLLFFMSCTVPGAAEGQQRRIRLVEMPRAYGCARAGSSPIVASAGPCSGARAPMCRSTTQQHNNTAEQEQILHAHENARQQRVERLRGLGAERSLLRLVSLWQSYLAALDGVCLSEIGNEFLSDLKAAQSQFLPYHVRSVRKDSGIGAFLLSFACCLLLEQRDCARYSSDAASGILQISSASLGRQDEKSCTVRSVHDGFYCTNTVRSTDGK